MFSSSGSKNSAANLSFLEPLEARVAPAVLFGHADGSLVDGEGNAYTQSNETAAHEAGADALYLFQAGDKLILDTNGNNKFDKGEVTQLAVKTGAAAVYFKNLNDGGTTWDITGMAASDKFGGTINADVHGDIATMLAATQTGYELTVDFNGQGTTLLNADITNLTINGHVTGNVIAGGDILGLKITDFNQATHQAVGDLLAGIAGHNATVNFSASTDSVYDATLQHEAIGEGTDGGSIRGVTITGGVGHIVAGAGASSSSGVGGDGGSVSNILLLEQTSQDHLMVIAGGGGDGVKAGGAGGNVSSVKISGESFAEADFYAGNGGDGHSDLAAAPLKGAAGGKGGTISNIHLDGLVAGTWLGLFAGDGGDGSGSGKGGVGGSIKAAAGMLSNSSGLSHSTGDGGTSALGDAKDGTLSGMKISFLTIDGSTHGVTVTYGGPNTYLTGPTIGSGTLTLTGGSGLITSGGGALTLSGSNSYTGATTISSGTLVTSEGSEVSGSYGGSIVGAGGLIKNGAGTLTLTGSNTYSGGTTINSGGLVVSSSLPSWMPSIAEILSGADLTINGQTYVFESSNATTGDRTYAGTSFGQKLVISGAYLAANGS